MAGRQPEERVRWPLARQRWRDVAFLHWPYDATVVQALLPVGLVADVRDGNAWVGLTPFQGRGFRPPFVPAVPRLSDFPETNLRTYVIGPDGRDGLWFLTLEVDSLATVAAARTALGVPYHWARMSVERSGSRVKYTSERRGDPAIGHRITVEPGSEPADDDGLAEWLTGRWRAWTRIAGRLATVAVQHEPWPLATATAVEVDETLLAAVGLPPPTQDPLVHTSPGVDAALSWPAFA